MPPVPLVADLAQLSNRLGDPALDYAILGEGNTSARDDDGTYWIKASGCCLATATVDHFVRIDASRILPHLDAPAPTDDEVRAILERSRVDPEAGLLPSVETFMHAALLELDGVRFVGHAHPTAINAITCANGFEAALEGRLFPDEIVVCGPAPVLVPYIDPGLPLAQEIRRRVREHMDRHGDRPKTIMMQNHGLIALGATAQQVEDIFAMAVKTARILAGTMAFGGPRFLPDEVVERIHGRADEHYRQRMLGL